MTQATKYKHQEAFCLMNYASKDGSIREVLWNSRDGVTPFCIRDRSGKVELTHVHFHLDKCVPHHKPAPGDRIFVGITTERAWENRAKYVDKYWDAQMASQFGTKDAAIERLADADYNFGGEPGGSPMIEVVPDEPVTAEKQAQDLAVKGWASIPGAPLETEVWMVREGVMREGVMRDWRGIIAGARAQLSGILIDQLSTGASIRVLDAMKKLQTLLDELPQEAPYQPTPEKPGGPCSSCAELFPVFGEGALQVLGEALYCPKCADEKRRDQ